jgi:hypothetical protein
MGVDDIDGAKPRIRRGYRDHANMNTIGRSTGINAKSVIKRESPFG